MALNDPPRAAKRPTLGHRRHASYVLDSALHPNVLVHSHVDETYANTGLIRDITDPKTFADAPDALPSSDTAQPTSKPTDPPVQEATNVTSSVTVPLPASTPEIHQKKVRFADPLTSTPTRSAEEREGLNLPGSAYTQSRQSSRSYSQGSDKRLGTIYEYEELDGEELENSLKAIIFKYTGRVYEDDDELFSSSVLSGEEHL